MNKREFRKSEQGFTLPELLVAGGIGLVVTALALGSALNSKEVMQRDLVRTRMTQNLRSGIDLLGIDIRLAGENFPSQVSAIEVVNGQDGASDELIVRRAIIGETLTVCNIISSGSSNRPEVGITDGMVTNTDGSTRIISSCDVDDPGLVSRQTAWQEVFDSQPNESFGAYIFDVNARVGEIFMVSGFNVNGTTLEIVPEAGSSNWSNGYNQNAVTRPTLMLLVEEWRYQLQDRTVQIIINGDTQNPVNVVTGITDMQFRVTLNDGTEVDNFTPAMNWTDINAVQVTLEATDRDKARGQDLTRRLAAEFFPRNVLSN
jgi:type II secretory pathway pseudopilin PulG